MENQRAWRELACAIVQRYPGAVVALMRPVGVPVPDHVGARALPAVLAGFGAGALRGAGELLDEMLQSDPTLAELYLRALVEEVREMTMVGEALRPDMFERLRELKSFREYEAKVEAEADAEAKAEAETAVKAEDLTDFLVIRGDAPSEHALNTISACRNAGLLAAWLKRAYLRETSAQLFPEPKPPTS